MAIADQLKCKIHPSQYITNFCSKPSCNVELCATCICQHTQFHNRTNTKPEYENIKETFLKTNDNLNKFKESLTKQKTRIKNIMDNIEKKRKEVQKVFKQAKEDVLGLVEKTFSDLEKQFMQSLVREKQKTGLLNQARLDELYAQINRRALEVYSTTQQLNNMRQINNIKKVNAEFIPKGVEFRQEIAQQITYNQMFQPNVSYKSSYLDEVAGSLKRLICLSFSYPVKSQPRQHRNTGAVDKTPGKDIPQQIMQQTAMGNTFGRPSQMMVKSPIQMARSPGKLQSQTRNSQFCPFRPSMKQNNGWAFNQDPVMKVFGNTFTN